ncbi:hypothetical protein BDQ94DRAFT_41677 [Aspergillus welwitschiae]|uniref:Uncharacterized protein n=1 Tax=Aspergillus welwitschiae TaxID=1341132 RepID=A0A3F3PH49_9EURO|nr:hypothetical protein BDQ94DRAFT_41677 [Aspergillus welwitschiae]RDH26209.1 hypothetical protein BDQ94DRAFT_41677 [Aspergillus welwitschiae]
MGRKRANRPTRLLYRSSSRDELYDNDQVGLCCVRQTQNSPLVLAGARWCSVVSLRDRSAPSCRRLFTAHQDPNPPILRWLWRSMTRLHDQEELARLNAMMHFQKV